MTEINIYFQVLKEGAIIPSKNEEDAGYDIYPCFKEDYIKIRPHQIELIPTGIASAFDKDFVMVVFERGSTGTKNIAKRAGVIDSGYRGEWFIAINNTSNRPLIIAKNEKDFENNRYIIHPYKKAIAQGLLLPVPKTKIHVVEDIKNFKSIRGKGMLGSSGK